jgi:hypothetical protein
VMLGVALVAALVGCLVTRHLAEPLVSVVQVSPWASFSVVHRAAGLETVRESEPRCVDRCLDYQDYAETSLKAAHPSWVFFAAVALPEGFRRFESDLSLHYSGMYSDEALVVRDLFFELAIQGVAATLELVAESPHRTGTDPLQTFAISATECHHPLDVVQGQDQLGNCSNQAFLAEIQTWMTGVSDFEKQGVGVAA